MKQVKNLFVIAAVALAIIGSMAGCSSPTSPTPTPGNKDDTDKTPVVGDYDISGSLEQNVGKVTAITVTAKSGKSSGTVTVYYEGIEDTTYAKSTTLPTAAGTYAVTFNVAAASGWNAASGLSAGTLTINAAIDPKLPTPVADDYTVSGNLTQTVGSVTAVTVTAKSGKSSGKITVYYEGKDGTTYTKSTTLPSNAGIYAVTFNVAAVDGKYNAASGLSAGTLTINAANDPKLPTPVAGDYTISSNLTQTFGGVTAVTVTAQSGKSSGKITVYYEGTNSTTYAKSTTLPTNAGTYTVTFNVAAVDGKYNAASGLSAGTLTINKADPTVTTWPTAAGITYGAALSTSALTGGVSPVAGAFAWTDPATVPTVANTGYGVTFTPTDTGNYNTKAGTVSIIVTATYTISQIGGEAGKTTTTGLTFTFNGSIDGVAVSPSDITIDGTAATKPATATFTGSGTSWTLSPLTVSSSGEITVSISKTGIEAAAKTVQVFAVGTAAITVTFADISDAAGGIAITIPNLHRVSGTSTAILTLTDPEQYDEDSISWRVNGIEIGAGASVTLNAAYYANNTLGTHYLMISVRKAGYVYNKTIPFVVEY